MKTGSPDAIRLGNIDLSFHEASALEVEQILKQHGLNVQRSAAPHEEMFKRMHRREIDILVSAWLPASHGGYLAPFENEVRRVTVLYEPCCIWGVPNYVPASAVRQVFDLLKPEVVERMEKLIQGINPGAGISRFSKAMIDQYGLEEARYHFRPGTEAECFGRFEEAVAKSLWIVIPLWHPQALHHRYKIRALVEPKGLLGGIDEATLIVRRDAEDHIGAAALDALAGLHLGNEKVSELDDNLRLSKGLERYQCAAMVSPNASIQSDILKDNT